MKYLRKIQLLIVWYIPLTWRIRLSYTSVAFLFLIAGFAPEIVSRLVCVCIAAYTLVKGARAAVESYDDVKEDSDPKVLDKELN